MRAFLAVPVLAPARDDLATLGTRLRAEIDGVRWAPLEGAHLTLHFFGSVGDDDAARALRAAAAVMADVAPLRLRLQGLGCFPDERHARVLWIGAAGDTAPLEMLALRCRAALSAAEFSVEERAWRPHCTLGRPRVPWPEQARRRWHELVVEAPATAWFIADHALLYESVQGRDGARHEPRARLAFGQPQPEAMG